MHDWGWFVLELGEDARYKWRMHRTGMEEEDERVNGATYTPETTAVVGLVVLGACRHLEGKSKPGFNEKRAIRTSNPSRSVQCQLRQERIEDGLLLTPWDLCSLAIDSPRHRRQHPQSR